MYATPLADANVWTDGFLSLGLLVIVLGLVVWWRHAPKKSRRRPSRRIRRQPYRGEAEDFERIFRV